MAVELTTTDAAWLERLMSDPALPPFETQRLFNRGADSATNVRTGFDFYRLALRTCERLGRSIGPTSRVLDFGSGWGRVLRCFERETSHRYGVDVYAPGVEAARRCDPAATYGVIPVSGPVEFADDSFDLVYAVSVFSHLPEDLHLKWLRELKRVLKAGGVLIVTTLSVDAVSTAARLRETSDLDAPWKRDLAAALPDRAGTDFFFGPVPRSDYGMAIIPAEYVERVWTRHLHLVDFTDDAALFHQAIVTLTKLG